MYKSSIKKSSVEGKEKQICNCSKMSFYKIEPLD